MLVFSRTVEIEASLLCLTEPPLQSRTHKPVPQLVTKCRPSGARAAASDSSMANVRREGVTAGAPSAPRP